MQKYTHSWSYCDLCDHWVVICEICGNNTCNGGGNDCCESAYEMYFEGLKMDEVKVIYENKFTGERIVLTTESAVDRFFDNRDPAEWENVTLTIEENSSDMKPLIG